MISAIGAVRFLCNAIAAAPRMRIMHSSNYRPLARDLSPFRCCLNYYLLIGY